MWMEDGLVERCIVALRVPRLRGLDAERRAGVPTPERGNEAKHELRGGGARLAIGVELGGGLNPCRAGFVSGAGVQRLRAWPGGET